MKRFAEQFISSPKESVSSPALLDIVFLKEGKLEVMSVIKECAAKFGGKLLDEDLLSEMQGLTYWFPSDGAARECASSLISDSRLSDRLTHIELLPEEIMLNGLAGELASLLQETLFHDDNFNEEDEEEWYGSN